MCTYHPSIDYKRSYRIKSIYHDLATKVLENVRKHYLMPHSFQWSRLKEFTSSLSQIIEDEFEVDPGQRLLEHFRFEDISHERIVEYLFECGRRYDEVYGTVPIFNEIRASETELTLLKGLCSYPLLNYPIPVSIITELGGGPFYNGKIHARILHIRMLGYIKRLFETFGRNGISRSFIPHDYIIPDSFWITYFRMPEILEPDELTRVRNILHVFRKNSKFKEALEKLT